MNKTLLKSVREYKKQSVLAPFFVILEVLMEVLIPMEMAKIIDVGIMQGNLSYIVRRGLILVIMAMLALYFGIIAGKMAAIAGAGYAKNLRHDIFYKVQEFSFKNIDRFSTSGLVTRMTTDITNVQMAYMMSIRLLARAPIMIVLSWIMTLLLNKKIALLFLIIIPLLGGTLIFIAKKAHPHFIKVFDEYDILNNSVQENVNASRVVKAFVREDHEIEKFHGISKYVYTLFTKAVKDFNLDIEDKEFIIFVGPSGCGKSTTLRMIAGLEDISGGTLEIDGKVMNDVEPKDRDIAMVFQNYALYPHMTVYDNMAFGLKLRKVPKDEIDRKVKEAARILDLEKLLDRKPKALSGGQRQRVAMGRAIVRNPKVFLMDEPLSNLDAKLRVQMRIEISKLHENLGATIIYVTHDQTEAMTLGTRIVVMKDGVVQQVDTPQNLYNTPCNLFVAGFIGSPQMNFMDAVVDIKGNDVTLTVGKHTLKVPASKKQALIDGGYNGRTVVLGIRPEDVHDSQAFISNSPDSVIESTIKVYELLGAEVYLYFDLEGTQMTARVNPRTTLRNGDHAVFALDMEKIHIFDKETELTITN